MNEILIQYNKLKSQLINVGCETSVFEVMHNDNIMSEMSDLIKDINKETAKLIILNHL